MELTGKEFRLGDPTMPAEEIARRLGVKHGGDFPAWYFHDDGKLVARKDGYDTLIVSDTRPDLQEKAHQFANEITEES
jgi:hypothetical protein